MYKMVVSDFKNSLINKEEAIPLSTMLEIDKVRQKNILFSITTSCGPNIIIDYNKDFPFIDFVVAFNGSYVCDVVNKKVIYNKRLASSISKRIYKLFEMKNICFYTLDYCNYIGNYKDKDYSKKIEDFSLFFEEYGKEIYKIKICAETEEEARNIIDVINEKQINVNSYLYREDDFFFVDITSVYTNRFAAVEKICKLKKIDLKDVMCICVDEASFDLVKNVGYSVSLSNGCERLKKISRFIGNTNDNKGVEEILKKEF